jgi:hypothetical protein
MCTLLRETPWIKEWQTPWGVFLDSKLRWLGVEPSADAFLTAWRTATEAEKRDLEAAFEFFPHELEEEINYIIQTIAAGGGEDEARAQRMAQKLFRADSRLTPQQEMFLTALGEHLQQTGSPMRLVGENRWFAAYANDAGFHIDTRVTSPLNMPTDENLQAQIDATFSLAYRRILQTVKENKWLLEPQPGERPFPT